MFWKRYHCASKWYSEKVVNGVQDNSIGSTNESQFLGNYIVIKHAENEYSLIAHLQQYSIIVNEGQNVKYGDIIGKVGNSGNSTEPHIHFQVMNDKNIEACTSLKIRFLNNLELIKGMWSADYKVNDGDTYKISTL